MAAKRIRILADDLTGALDTAAAWATPDSPAHVSWAPRGTQTVEAVTSESRHLTGGEAGEAAARHAAWLAGAEVPFKKLDSLLRGHEAAEIAALLRTGLFGRAVIAPAFPAEQRITVSGQQYAHGVRVAADRSSSLAARLTALGVPVGDASMGTPGHATVHDAASDDELRAIVARERLRPGRVLWCGSAGLAYALGHADTLAWIPPQGSFTVIVGTQHPVTGAQLSALAARAPHSEAIQLVQPLPPAGLSAAAARHWIASELIRQLPALTPPALALVTGGDTLSATCRALGASTLAVHGTYRPGLSVFRFLDSAWADTWGISKSGAFGAPDLLVQLLHRTTRGVHA